MSEPKNDGVGDDGRCGRSSTSCSFVSCCCCLSSESEWLTITTGCRGASILRWKADLLADGGDSRPSRKAASSSLGNGSVEDRRRRSSSLSGARTEVLLREICRVDDLLGDEGSELGSDAVPVSPDDEEHEESLSQSVSSIANTPEGIEDARDAPSESSLESVHRSSASSSARNHPIHQSTNPPTRHAYRGCEHSAPKQYEVQELLPAAADWRCCVALLVDCDCGLQLANEYTACKAPYRHRIPCEHRPSQTGQ